MKLDKIGNWKEHIPKVLLTVSLALAVLTVGKVLAFAVTSVRTRGRIEQALSKNGQNDEAIKARVAANRAAADKIKGRNMFAEPKAKPKPPICIAILGSKALINDKWYKVGDEVGGAKISAIGPKEVTILWEEKEKKLFPFAASDRKEQARPVSKNRREPRERRAEAVRPRPMPEEGGQPWPGLGRRGMGRFFDMSEDERRQMGEKMRNMSREERREFFRQRREEFESGQN